jgi:hypothetical protein
LLARERKELRLMNPEDLLETGIDIIAQPPGKKLTSLELVVTRSAPGLGTNAGGAIEVVTNPGGVGNLWFHMP